MQQCVPRSQNAFLLLADFGGPETLSLCFFSSLCDALGCCMAHSLLFPDSCRSVYTMAVVLLVSLINKPSYTNAHDIFLIAPGASEPSIMQGVDTP